MNTLDERLTTRQKLLENLKTSVPWLVRQGKILHIPHTSRYQTEKMPDDHNGQVNPDFNPHIEVPTGIPSLEVLLLSNGDQPPYTIILGLCDDGLPLTLNLTNPAPGSLLLAGDHESGKTRLLRSILSSVTMINPADLVLFFILTNNRNEYTDLAELDNCKKLLTFQDQAATRLIPDLFEESEKRRSKPSDTVVVVAIDELSQYLQSLDSASLSQFLRLIKHGPRLGIWILATLTATELDQIDPVIVEAFRTHLIGYLSDPVQATFLAHDATCPAQELSKGVQWLVPMSGYWVSFRICDPGGGVS